MPTKPGSAEAKRLGCTCPVLDNSYGDGAIVEGQLQKDKWFVDPECPIHVDERRLHAQFGGAGDSGGADGEVSGVDRGGGTPDSIQTPSSQPAGESQSAPTLPGPDEGDRSGQEGGDTAVAGQSDTGRGAQA